MSPDDRRLDYAPPEPPRRVILSPWVALPLCMPGMYCWLLLLFIIARIEFPGFVAGFVRTSFLPMWIAAILTAIASLALYARPLGQPRPPAVRWNLWVNVCGLLFSLLVLVPHF